MWLFRQKKQFSVLRLIERFMYGESFSGKIYSILFHNTNAFAKSRSTTKSLVKVNLVAIKMIWVQLINKAENKIVLERLFFVETNF